MASPIESTKNPLIRRFRASARGEDAEVMVAEGQRLVEAALDSDLDILEVAFSPRLLARPGGKGLLDRLREGSAP